MRGKPFPKGNIPHNKTPDIEFICETCGNSFTRTVAYIEKVGIPRTCSRTCHNRRVASENKVTGRLKGANNGRWVGGVSITYYRKLFEEQLTKKCQCCGSTRYLCVHHKDRERSNNDLDNLEVLCKSCHQKEHDVIRNIIGSS